MQLAEAKSSPGPGGITNGGKGSTIAHYSNDEDHPMVRQTHELHPEGEEEEQELQNENDDGRIPNFLKKTSQNSSKNSSKNGSRPNSRQQQSAVVNNSGAPPSPVASSFSRPGSRNGGASSSSKNNTTASTFSSIESRIPSLRGGGNIDRMTEVEEEKSDFLDKSSSTGPPPASRQIVLKGGPLSTVPEIHVRNNSITTIVNIESILQSIEQPTTGRDPLDITKSPPGTFRQQKSFNSAKPASFKKDISAKFIDIASYGKSNLFHFFLIVEVISNFIYFLL
jgi:hypothetical protein